MENEDADLDLIRRAVAGDPVALTALLADSRDRLRDYLAQRIPSDLRGMLDAEDLVQEAHAEAFRHTPTFVPRGPDSFHRWVATIALQKLRDVIRRERARRRGGEQVMLASGWGGRAGSSRSVEDSCIVLLDLIQGPGRTPSLAAVRAEAVAAVQSAVAALPEAYREAVCLVYIDGYSVAAAAERMGRTEPAVHDLCYKAREQLRQILRTWSGLSGSFS